MHFSAGSPKAAAIEALSTQTVPAVVNRTEAGPSGSTE
jgi:hypothetical protein